MALVQIYELSDRFEAEVVRNLLSEEDLYFELATHAADPLENVLSLQQGFGTVWVEEEDQVQALELIRAGLSAKVLEPGDEGPSAASGPGSKEGSETS